MNFFKPRPKIGLALGCGGPKGLAHIGVIKVLEQNNIPIDYIAGTSIGALIGGFYAAKKNIAEIEHIAIDIGWRQAFSFLFEPTLRQGLIKGDKLKKFIENYIGQTTFKELKIPFSAVATDLKTGKKVILRHGPVANAIRSSISIPIILQPVATDETFLADGGISCPVPVEVVKKMGADLVIAVNLNTDCRLDIKNKKYGFSRIANNSLSILGYNLADENAKNADLVICPKVGHISWRKLFTREGSLEGIKIGEETTTLLISKLKRVLDKEENPIIKLFNNIFRHH